MFRWAMANVIVFNIFLIAVCGLALAYGGAPERIVATLLLVAAAMTYAVQAGEFGAFRSTEVDILLIDAGLLVALIVVALYADRFWPIWMIALHGLTMMVHLAKAYQPDLVPVIYGMAVGKLAYPMLCILAVATRRYRQRRAKMAADKPWATSSATLTPGKPANGLSSSA